MADEDACKPPGYGALAAEPTIWPLPPPPLTLAPPPELGADARHEVATSQWSQSKVMAPKFGCATVWPWNRLLASIVTPLKSIQPTFWPQAEPESAPPLLVTPPLVGERLIQPNPANQI